MTHGGIDRIDRLGVHGWVRGEDDTPLSLSVVVDDQPGFRILANLYRSDVEQAGFGNGRHGFAFELPGLSPLRSHIVRIMREDDGTLVAGTPHTIPPAVVFNDTLLDQVSAAMADTTSDEELARRAVFMAQQADRLLQLRADRRAGRPHPTSLRTFRVRWTGQGENPDPDPAPRALVIDVTLPEPDRDAGSAAVLSHIGSLQRLGFKVSVAAADADGRCGPALEALGIACYAAPWCGSVEEALRRERGTFQLVYIHRVASANYLPLIRSYQPRAKLVYCVADLHHVRLHRQGEVEQRPELAEASRRVRLAELSAARAADCVITHSSAEAALLRHALPDARVHTMAWSVPCRPTMVPWEHRRGVAFIGSFGHAPNLDAAWWLIQEVMPLVRAEDPAIECLLVGSGMPAALQAVVSPGIRAVGRVESLASVFDQVRLTAAALTFGAGVKGKVLDSMAGGIPPACTPVAAEGIALPEPLRALVSGEASGLARAILRLHNDEALNRACRDAGLSFVAEHLSEQRLDAAMREALDMRVAT